MVANVTLLKNAVTSFNNFQLRRCRRCQSSTSMHGTQHYDIKEVIFMRFTNLRKFLQRRASISTIGIKSRHFTSYISTRTTTVVPNREANCKVQFNSFSLKFRSKLYLNVHPLDYTFARRVYERCQNKNTYMDIVQPLVLCLIVGLALFSTAGTLFWFNGWIFLILLYSSSVGIMLWMLMHNPGMIVERMVSNLMSSWDKL